MYGFYPFPPPKSDLPDLLSTLSGIYTNFLVLEDTVNTE